MRLATCEIKQRRKRQKKKKARRPRRVVCVLEAGRKTAKRQEEQVDAAVEGGRWKMEGGRWKVEGGRAAPSEERRPKREGHRERGPPDRDQLASGLILIGAFPGLQRPHPSQNLGKLPFRHFPVFFPSPVHRLSRTSPDDDDGADSRPLSFPPPPASRRRRRLIRCLYSSDD